MLSYQYRRLICKAQYNFALSTNALSHTYAALPREIDAAKNISEKLLDILTGKGRSQMFPRNDVFKTAFQTFDLYSAKLAKYTLAMLENILNPTERFELTEEITIEHIMPQTLSAVWKADLGRDYEQIHTQWQHTVGNLTLSGNNSKLGNESYSDKKKVYLNSNVALSRDAANDDLWDAKTIQARAARLFDKALEIWSLPDKYSKATGASDIDYSVAYNIMDDIKATDETPRTYIVDEREYKVDSWAALFVGILRYLHDFDPATFEKFAQHETVVKRHLAERDDSGYAFRTKTSGKEVVPGYKAETNASAQDLLSFTQIAVELYGLEDFVEFTLKRKVPKKSAANAISNGGEIEQAFKDWFVGTGKTDNTANQYATILRGTLVRNLEIQDSVSLNLFEYADSEVFAGPYALICALPNWDEVNEYKHNSFSAAVGAYNEFLKAHQQLTIVEQEG